MSLFSLTICPKRPQFPPVAADSGYNDCMEVTLGFSVRSAETDEWSGVSPADGKMQRVLRALDWQ